MIATVHREANAGAEKRPEPASGGSFGLSNARRNAGSYHIRQARPQTSFRTGLACAEERVADRETTKGSCHGKCTMAQGTRPTPRGRWVPTDAKSACAAIDGAG